MTGGCKGGGRRKRWVGPYYSVSESNGKRDWRRWWTERETVRDGGGTDTDVIKYSDGDSGGKGGAEQEIG